MKIFVQAFPLQCLPTHNGGSVYAGPLPDYNDLYNNNTDNNNENATDGGDDEKNDGGKEC